LPTAPGLFGWLLLLLMLPLLLICSLLLQQSRAQLLGCAFLILLLSGGSCDKQLLSWGLLPGLHGCMLQSRCL
jgi:hypothetical protein